MSFHSLFHRSVLCYGEEQVQSSSFPLSISISFEEARRFLFSLLNTEEASVAQWLRCCATNRKDAGSIPAGVIGIFIDIKSFRSQYGPGVDSASNRNEYQDYFLGGKGGRYVRLTTLPPSCGVVTKSGSLNFLEPSGPSGPVTGMRRITNFPVNDGPRIRLWSHNII